MLENEPGNGAAGTDGDTTEQQSTRRRGAASRPAGPPPLDDTPSVIVAAPAESPAGEAKPKKAVTRRRTTKKAEQEAAETPVAKVVEVDPETAAAVKPGGRRATRAPGPPAFDEPEEITVAAAPAPLSEAAVGRIVVPAPEELAVNGRTRKATRPPGPPRVEDETEAAAASAPAKPRRTRKKAETAKAEETAAAEAGAAAPIADAPGEVRDAVGEIPQASAEAAESVAERADAEAEARTEAQAEAQAGAEAQPAARTARGRARTTRTATGSTRSRARTRASSQEADEPEAGAPSGDANVSERIGAGTPAAAEASAQAVDTTAQPAAGAGEAVGSGVSGGVGEGAPVADVLGTGAAIGGGVGEGAPTGAAQAAATQAAAAQTGTAAEAVSQAGTAAAGVARDDAEGADVDEELLEELPEDEPLDDEPAGEDLDEEPISRPGLLADPFGFAARREDQPDVTFQRPATIFTPLFQAPDPSQAVPARIQVNAPIIGDDEVELEEPDDTAEEEAEDAEREDGGGRRRRRRRGGRGRGKSRERDEGDEGDEAEDGAEEEQSEEQPQQEEAEEEETQASTSRRRRRRRRRSGDEDAAEPLSDDPPNTVVRIRAPRAGRTGSLLEVAADGVQSVKGSTRLEAKKQRRREGRELGRRRPPIITEAEFLARRESVDRMMVVRRTGDRTQIAVLEDGILVEHYVNREASQSYVGNVYLGKVQNVLPSMEAAFVDIGKGRNAVLYAGEVNFDTAGLEGQPKRIETALKSGQSVLVQVTKDPIGHKGARLTSQISLPGRYLVYVPDGSMTGISRKLPDKERARLKSILKKVMPDNAGVIVRTAAEGASEEELARDVARLSAQWENIQKRAKSASPPELLSAEPDLTIRVVRDVFNEDFSSLVVQGQEAWETVEEYVKYVAPHLADRLSYWQEDTDVFEAHRIDEQLAKALERKVWLPSGGSLVIDRTEAMTVVDVNTGKFTGQGGNLEETVTRNNLEAAEEIVRQLRLRDIGGIIVIDFIDMVLESNRDLVLRRLLECLARDRTKHQVAEVTSLGLVQMTRKRVGQGLLEAFSTPCECCNGRGLIVSTEPVEAKSDARGTQGKMAVEKAVAEKVSAAKESAGRDTVTGALDDVPSADQAGDDQANQTSGRGRRRSRRAKSADS
ncbi:Rne/Rng family ribonuclease [Thermoactinospora rubra]|uniref:Rne/Rng family ribonuclease n=1 Tax=Thermoactinospora rubra TaxID=1088767 RepID=UPI001F0AB12C|nr:Rne/Rng family ribonuclease [Thermoactinospora rubra]